MIFKTHFEFRSDAFPVEADEEEYNPGIHGRKLATFLFQQLEQLGLPAKTPTQEDWGWIVPINNPRYNVFLGCGPYQEYKDGFLVFIEPCKPFIRKWFRRIETGPVISPIICAAYMAIENSKSVYGLRWWDEQEMAQIKSF
jgi:hypothetical protein